jgi:radical SAM superfamily enzyme YgiQ (UPF0313 family)
MQYQRPFLLIKPPFEYYPMGLAYVASTLERSNWVYDYVDSYYEELDLENRISNGKYFAVGSGGLIGDYFFLESLFERIKSIDKKIICILGGHIASDVNHKILFNHMPIDCAVVGEAEITLPKLLSEIVRGEENYHDLRGIIFRDKEGRIVKTKPQRRLNLEEQHAFPSYTFFDHSSWTVSKLPIPIITGRGCVGHCTFCSPSHRRFMARPFADIFQEVGILTERFQVKQIQFLNEVFFDDEQTIVKFCDEFKRRFKTPFCCVLRSDMDPKILAHLKEAGCVGFNIGVESGSNRILKKMCKGITVDQTRAFIREAQRIGGFNITSGFMIGNESETEAEIEKTIALHDELKIQSGISLTIPYPGTVIYKRALKKGLIQDEYKFLGAVNSMWHHEYRTDLYFLKNNKGRPMIPNITQIPDDKFVDVMQSAYLRLYSRYALKNTRLISKQNQIWMTGNCPVCHADVQIEFDLDNAFIKNLSCPNVTSGRCYNNLEFHAHIYTIPKLKKYAERVTGQLKTAEGYVFCGNRCNIKFLIDHNIFKIKFEDIIGICTFESCLADQYLYSDKHGHWASNTKIYSPEEIVKMQPGAIIIADMTPAALDMESTLVQLGYKSENIYRMCPPGSIPYPQNAYYWRPVNKISDNAKAVIWPAGTFGKKILEGEIVSSDQITAYADKNSKLRGKKYFSKKIVLPQDLSNYNFSVIIIASEAYLDPILKQIKTDTYLNSKEIYYISEKGGMRKLQPFKSHSTFTEDAKMISSL